MVRGGVLRGFVQRMWWLARREDQRGCSAGVAPHPGGSPWQLTLAAHPAEHGCSAGVAPYPGRSPWQLTLTAHPGSSPCRAWLLCGCGPSL
eukprot:706257-Pyramimonas_sp.AAC.1